MKPIKDLLKGMKPPKKYGEAIRPVMKKMVDGATAVKLARKKINDARVSTDKR